MATPRLRSQCMAVEVPPNMDVTGEICRLCFRKGYLGNFDDVRHIVQAIAGVGHAKGDADVEVPDEIDKICMDCSQQLHDAWLLRKRILLTDAIFDTYRNRLTVQDPYILEDQLELACHVCGGTFRYDDLLEHIANSHSVDHVPDCGFCLSMLTYQALSIVEEEEVVDHIKQESDNVTEDGQEEEYNESEYEPEEESPAKQRKYQKKVVNTGPRKQRFVYACTECTKPFSRKDHLRNHLIKKHGIERPSKELQAVPENFKQIQSYRYTCKFCEETFAEKELMKAHVIEAHNIQEVIETLPDTSATLSPPKLEINQRPFVCHVCERAFAKKDALVHHLRIRHKILQVPKKYAPPGHPDHKPCVCPVCSKSLAYPKTLARHMRMNHKMEQSDVERVILGLKSETQAKFICPTCGKDFHVLYKYDRHLLEHSPDPFPCSVCDEVFPSRGHRKNHEITCYLLNATRSMNYVCNQCALVLSGLEELKQHRHGTAHQTEKIDLSYVCADCDFNQSFAEAQEMLDHLNNVHGKLGCSGCSKYYPNTVKLRTHFQHYHKVQSSLVCTVCGQQLSRPDKLVEHMWTHTGFLCSICNIKFATRKEIHQHRRENHPRYVVVNMDEEAVEGEEVDVGEEGEVEEEQHYEDDSAELIEVEILETIQI